MKTTIDAIDRFLFSRMYHYAFLINGKWGCGKTYFIQNELIPHIRELSNKEGLVLDVNYISLYGVSSMEEISQMLCVQAIKDKMGKVGDLADTKAGQIATVLISAATKIGLGKLGSDNSDLENLIATIPDYKNNVIIFDDLERCSCDIVEVLGYINNFVEHSDASIILAANEDEIGNWQLDRNPEMQMLLALDKRIDVEVTPTEEEYIRDWVVRNQNQQKEQRENYTVEQLEQKRKAIFHGNEGYKRIKEKVIGQTIEYEPNLMEVLPKIIDGKNLPKVLHDELLFIIDDLTGILDKEEHRNLRTFQFFLEKCKTIYDDIQEKYVSAHQIILLYLLRSTVRYMKGKGMPVWNGDYGDQEFGTKAFYSDAMMGFRFIDDLIVKNQFDTNYVNEVLSRFASIAEKKGNLKNDPYQKIRDWYLASDGEVEDWLIEIEKNISSGKYSTELYTGLLRHIADLYSYNVMTDHCDKIYHAMKEYIKQAEPDMLEELEYEHFILEGNAGKIYGKLRSEIEELLMEKKRRSEKQMFEEAMKGEDWGSKLLKKSTNSGNVKGHSFIFWLEPKRIAGKIAESSNAQLQQFRFAMQCYYDRSTYYEAKADDVDHLQELKNLLEEADMEGVGQIQRNYYKWIIGDIERYLEEIGGKKV